MTISVSCGKCGQKYHVKDGLAGRRLTCKICQSPILIPHPAPLVDEIEDLDVVEVEELPRRGRTASVGHDADSDLPVPEKKKSSALKIILIVGGSLCLVMLLVCGGGAWWVYGKYQQAQVEFENRMKSEQTIRDAFGANPG